MQHGTGHLWWDCRLLLLLSILCNRSRKQMRRIIALMVFSTVAVALMGCRSSSRNKFITVEVFRDPKGPMEPWLSKALMEFQGSSNSALSERRILVATDEPAHYARTLQDVGDGLRPDLIILNSRADAAGNQTLSAQTKEAQPLCASDGNCPAFIPSWVPAEKREAANRLLTFLISKRRQAP